MTGAERVNSSNLPGKRSDITEIHTVESGVRISLTAVLVIYPENEVILLKCILLKAVSG